MPRAPGSHALRRAENKDRPVADPLFPIRERGTDPANAVLTIEPYRCEGAWVFDDPTTGLVGEPFVAGITEMIDRLAANIPGAARGFRLLFAVQPFNGS